MQDIQMSPPSVMLCSFTGELSSCSLFSVENVFSMPHEICRCEVKGTRPWRLFYGELSCTDVLVNITIVAVNCLIKWSTHDNRYLPIV